LFFVEKTEIQKFIKFCGFVSSESGASRLKISLKQSFVM